MKPLYRQGKYYSVPCVYYEDYWLPVLLPLHADPEVGGVAVYPHYHFDWRFISRRMCIEVWSRSSYDYLMGYVAWETTAPLLLSYRRVQCCRVMPNFPREREHAVTGAKKRTLLTLKVEELCAGKCIKNLENPVCPHKGISLAGLPVDANGCVICPGHGLRWNLRTGEMVTDEEE